MFMPTKSQQLLLDFIELFTDENNFSPSYREIVAALGLGSVATVAQHIDNCVAAGYLIKVPHAARSLRVIRGEGFDESRRLFQTHIDAIKDRIEQAEGDQDKINALNDDLMTLRAAAKILKLEI